MAIKFRSDMFSPMGFIDTDIININLASGGLISRIFKYGEFTESVSRDMAVLIINENEVIFIGEDIFKFGGGIFCPILYKEIGTALGVNIIDLFQQTEDIGDIGYRSGSYHNK